MYITIISDRYGRDGLDNLKIEEINMAGQKKGKMGLFEYGQMQKSKGGDQKLFPAIEDLNPRLKGKCGRKRRGQ